MRLNFEGPKEEKTQELGLQLEIQLGKIKESKIESRINIFLLYFYVPAHLLSFTAAVFLLGS